jgi:hypothetical protein
MEAERTSTISETDGDLRRQQQIYRLKALRNRLARAQMQRQ